MHQLEQLVQRHKAGEPVGIYSVCSAHPLVIEAAMEQALQDDSLLLIEAPPTRWISLAATPG